MDNREGNSYNTFAEVDPVPVLVSDAEGAVEEPPGPVKITKSAIIWSSICFAVILAFGISVAVVYQQGEESLVGPAPCSLFPSNITYFELIDDVWSLTRWRYNLKSPVAIDGHVTQIVPTLYHDVLLTLDGRLSARSETQLSWGSDVRIYDCQRNHIFSVRSDFGTSLINSMKLSTSLLIFNGQGGIVGYVEGQAFFDRSFQIKSAASNQVVATMERSWLDLPKKWKVTISEPSDPASDPRVLSILAVKNAFQGKETDAANDYFTAATWITIISLALFIIVVLVVIYNSCKRGVVFEWNTPASPSSLAAASAPSTFVASAPGVPLAVQEQARNVQLTNQGPHY